MQSAQLDLISVIVPIYKVEPYLIRCVDSILQQTYKNLEIILVDDGSPDKCPLLCDQLQRQDARIKVIHKENGGLSDARNAGIEVMTGKYVTFIDSDDYIDPDYISYLYQLIKKFNAEISICSYKAIYTNGTILTQENGKEYCLNVHDTLEHMLYHKEFNVATWAKLYQSDLFREIRFPKGKIFEDVLTTYRLVDLCKTIAVGTVSKYNYMIRDDSILTGPFSMKKLTLITAYEEMGAYLVKKYPDLQAAVIRSIVYGNLSTLRQLIYSKPRLKQEEKKIRKYILKNKRIVLNNDLVDRRDKLAIVTLCFGTPVFAISWKIYCRLTGRRS